jgi:hypothetical protein
VYPTVYDDEYPVHLGPPPVPNYEGREVLEARQPRYGVELDAGAFRAVWELLESEARHRFPTHETMASAQALLRAVDSFRETYWAMHDPPSPAPRKHLIRRTGR